MASSASARHVACHALLPLCELKREIRIVSPQRSLARRIRFLSLVPVAPAPSPFPPLDCRLSNLRPRPPFPLAMYSLKRLTGAVLSRSSVRMATATTVPSPMASPPPQMSHSFGSLSGKETSYSQEVTDKPQKEFQKEKKTAKQAQKDSNDGQTSDRQTSHRLRAFRGAHPFLSFSVLTACSCVVCVLCARLLSVCVLFSASLCQPRGSDGAASRW